MDFLKHLESEFAYSSNAFLQTVKRLPESKTVVVSIGISSLSYDTGSLNIRKFKNFIRDISEFVNANSKRHIIIVISDSLEKTRYQYLQSDESLASNFGLRSALVTLAHNDIVNLFCDGFANYNLRAVGFSLSSDAADTGSFGAAAKKTADTLKGLFRHFPRTVPIIMEDTSQSGLSEGSDGFAVKIAISVNADAVVSISKKGMLYTADPASSENALPFYCFDTSRSAPFDEHRKAALSKKLSAAARVNEKAIPLLLTAYTNPYTVCDIFDKAVASGIENGAFPEYTLFINSKRTRLSAASETADEGKKTSPPIDERQIEGRVFVDANAEKALTEGKKSLLSVGIVKVEGEFGSKAAVEILNQKSVLIGRGVVNCGSAEIKNDIKQRKAKKSVKAENFEVINRTKMRIGEVVSKMD
ncbi:MAG: hypothetical protein FWH03_02815 [Firmicutes bacterium]|nr:hypothetical protein [Bacillota bacterium]